MCVPDRAGLHDKARQCLLQNMCTAHFRRTPFRHLQHPCRVGKKGRQAYRYEHVHPPASVDWRSKNIIGPIKDQHANGSACGCCWAFATIGTAECMVAMATGKVLSLSEQQVRHLLRTGSCRLAFL